MRIFLFLQENALSENFLLKVWFSFLTFHDILIMYYIKSCPFSLSFERGVNLKKKKFFCFILCAALLLGIGAIGGNLQISAQNSPQIFWINESYDHVYPSSQGLIKVKKEDKYGFIDKDGKMSVSIEYDEAYQYEKDIIIVLKNGKYGIINSKGEEIAPLQYDEIVGFFEGLSAVKKGTKWGFINKEGKEVIYPIFDDVRSFSESLAIFVVNDSGRKKTGYIDQQGKIVIEPNFSQASGFRNGVAKVKAIGETHEYFIDRQGKKISQKDVPQSSNKDVHVSIHDVIGGLKENIVSVGQEGNKSAYDRVYRFSNGLARVKRDYKFGYADEKLSKVIELKYDDAKDFKEGLAAVKKDSQWSYIDRNGENMFGFAFEKAGSFSEGVAIVNSNGKWGILKHPLGEPPVEEKPKENQEEEPKEGENPKEEVKNTKNVSNNSGKKKEVKKQEPVKKTEEAPKKEAKEEKPKKKSNEVFAKYNNVNISINGVKMSDVEIYYIGNSNYLKLRDIAKLVAGTDKKFSVTWNEKKKIISLVTGEKYKFVGGELKAGDGKDKNAIISSTKLEINGELKNLTAYRINENHYFNLREIAAYLGITVDWDSSDGMIIIKAYQ